MNVRSVTIMIQSSCGISKTPRTPSYEDEIILDEALVGKDPATACVIGSLPPCDQRRLNSTDVFAYADDAALISYRMRYRLFAAMALPVLGTLPAHADPPRFACLIEPFREIKLATPSSGVLEHVLVDRGDIVKAGQLVARLTSAIEEAELASAQIKARDDSNLQSKLAKRQLAEAHWNRLKALTGEARFMSLAQTEQAEADALQARAEVIQAQTDIQLAAVDVKHAEARLAQRSIVSPLNGVVTKRDLSEGEYGYEQQPVLTLAQLDPLSVELFLPVAEDGTLHEGDAMKIEPQAPIGGDYTGKVTVIDRNFDSRSGTFGVRVSLPNPEIALPAGIRCTASKLPIPSDKAN